MTDAPLPHQLARFPDRDALTTAVADGVLTRARQAIAGHGRADVCLTGGSAGIEVVAALVQSQDGLTDEEWARVHLWWGDERFVPTGDAERTVDQSRDVGLARLPVPQEQVHVAPASSGADAAPGVDTAEDAASAYAATYAEAGSPAFDVLLLGVGPDAHVASLFPDRPELGLTGPDDPAVVAVHDSPKPPPTRLTFTLPVLRAARAVWFVVAGADKAQAVASALATSDDPAFPASCVQGTRETVWWLDDAASGATSEQLTDS